MKLVCTTTDCEPTTLKHDKGNAAAFHAVGMSADKRLVLKIRPFCEPIPGKGALTGGIRIWTASGKSILGHL
jgi:hypothetical protein